MEPTLDCHQKESVQVRNGILILISILLCIVYFNSIRIMNQQGSHVMAHNGGYVLQWICPAECDLPAQLMFFFEVLSSENYKGSMSNLQSGISAMSLASSCQSR